MAFVGHRTCTAIRFTVEAATTLFYLDMVGTVSQHKASSFNQCAYPNG